MKFNLSDFLQLDTKELLAVNGGFYCNGSSNTTVYPNTYYPSTPGGAGSNLPSSSRAVVGSSIRIDGTIRYDYDDGSHIFVYPDGQRQFYPGSDGKSKENNGKDASSSSGGGSCSTSTSNNPNGQGPSTTSSNPGGNQHKDTKIHNGGGTCSSKNDTDKVSGMFGQITDGSYADELTMQYYANGNVEIRPFYSETPAMAKMHDKEMNGNKLFSKEGCLMACTAKVISEECDDQIYLRDINKVVDVDSNGCLSNDEIANGINKFLDAKYGDIYDVIGTDINNVTLTDLNEAATPADGDITFVLGNAPDCFGGHWIVLEGYSTNSDGIVTFSYDGSSDNDIGRSFVLGKSNQDTSNNVWGITRIQTFTIHKK